MATGLTKALGAIALKCTLVAGAAANADIAVTGIAVEDTIIGVIHLEGTATYAAPADRLSEASITSAGNIQLTTTNTTGDFLLLLWHDASL